MKIITNKLYTILFTIGLLCFCYIILNIPKKIEPIWKAYPDVNDYKTQSEASLTSLNFYSPKPTLRVDFFPRPFIVPLFFKIAGSDPINMILVQKITYCICIISLLVALLYYIANFWIKIIMQFSLLFFFTWWNIVGWSNIPVSESLSISMMFLWFSSILFYYKKQNMLNIVFLVIASILLSFTRDTWPYIILLFFLLNIFILKFLLIGNIKKSVGLVIFSICLFFTQNYTSNIGERYKLPLFNTIAGRIAQNNTYLAWFKKEGMPQGKQLKIDFGNIKNIDIINNRYAVCLKYSDETYTDLFNWIVKDGKSKYQKFLLTHPHYFFLQDLSGKVVKQNLFSFNIPYYQKEEDFYVITSHVFPIFNWWFYLLFFPLLIFLFFKTKEIIYVFFATIFVLCFINAIITYNADSLEIKRHLFITRIILEFISISSVILLTNYISNLVIKKRSKTLL